MAEVEASLATAVGVDLSGYFSTWLHGKGAPIWPEFDVTVSQDGGSSEVTVTQRDNPKGLFGCAFAVTLKGEDQSAQAWFDLGPNGAKSTVVVVETPFTVDSTALDESGHCLIGGGLVGPAERKNPWVAGTQPAGL